MLSAAAPSGLAVACGLLANFFVVVSLYCYTAWPSARAARESRHISTPTSRRPNGPRSSRSTQCSRAVAGVVGQTGLGLGRAHALHRHGVGVERADTPPGIFRSIGGPTP